MESLEKSKNTKNEISLVTIALAFFPITGIFGVHDIAIKRYKQGIIHICTGVFAYIFFIFVILNPVENSSLVNVINGIAVVSLIASYVWAVIEGIQMLYMRNQDKIATNEEISAPVNNTATHQPAQDKKTKSSLYDIKAYSIISFILSLIPIVIWLYCLIVSGGSFNENGPGAVWWSLGIYYWSVGILFAIASIGFGIAGLKTKLKTLAIASLSIKALTILIIFCVLNFR